MLALAALTLVVGCAPQALAQPQERGGQNGQRLKGPGPHRGEWLRKNQNLPPAEQEKALQNDPAFKQLPPEKQQQLLNRLRNFNSLPPEQRQRILDRMETFEHLPQGQRQQLIAGEQRRGAIVYRNRSTRPFFCRQCPPEC